MRVLNLIINPKYSIVPVGLGPVFPAIITLQYTHGVVGRAKNIPCIIWQFPSMNHSIGHPDLRPGWFSSPNSLTTVASWHWLFSTCTYFRNIVSLQKVRKKFISSWKLIFFICIRCPAIYLHQPLTEISASSFFVCPVYGFVPGVISLFFSSFSRSFEG